jgi:hypothetical protein
MGKSYHPDCGRSVPNNLAFTQAQVNFILGYSLACLYQELLTAPVPEHLKAIVDRLDERAWSLNDGDDSR